MSKPFQFSMRRMFGCVALFCLTARLLVLFLVSRREPGIFPPILLFGCFAAGGATVGCAEGSPFRMGRCFVGLGGVFLLAYYIEDYWIWAYVNAYRHPVLATAVFAGATFSAGAVVGSGIGPLNQRPNRFAVMGGVLALIGMIGWALFYCETPWTM